MLDVHPYPAHTINCYGAKRSRLADQTGPGTSGRKTMVIYKSKDKTKVIEENKGRKTKREKVKNKQGR